MKFIEIQSKTSQYPSDTVEVDGKEYRIADIRTARRGLVYLHTIAYDDSQPVMMQAQEPAQQAPGAVEAVQPAQVTPEPVQAVQKPRFRLRKHVEPVQAPAPVEEVPAEVPTQPEPVSESAPAPVEAPQVDPVLLKALAELIVKQRQAEQEVREEPVKNADSSDVSEDIDVEDVSEEPVIEEIPAEPEPDNVLEMNTVDGGHIEVRYWMARD